MSSFEKYKSIFSSLENIKDINKISDLLDLNIEDKVIINNYYNTKNLPRKIPYDDFINLLDDLNNLKFKEDVIENLHKLGNKTNDISQINTIIRVANSKPEKYNNIINNIVKSKNKWFGISQNCPHCGISNMIDYDTDYAICGYTDVKNGYNWEGCGRDWCTRCGKKLCKKWNENNLFIEENRIHDSECCLLYNNNIENNYIIDFCQCYSNYVNRY
jgi:hypothetical protein